MNTHQDVTNLLAYNANTFASNSQTALGILNASSFTQLQPLPGNPLSISFPDPRASLSPAADSIPHALLAFPVYIVPLGKPNDTMDSTFCLCTAKETTRGSCNDIEEKTNSRPLSFACSTPSLNKRKESTPFPEEHDLAAQEDTHPICHSAEAKISHKLTHNDSSLRRALSPAAVLSPTFFPDRKAVLSFPTSLLEAEPGVDSNYLSRRCDVVYKTILRDLRRYLLNDFNARTNFQKRKRYRPELFFQEQMLRYVSEHMGCSGVDEKTMFFYISSLLYPKHLRTSALWNERGEFGTSFNENAFENEAFLNERLYNFSLEKLEVLMKDKYVATLFLFYAQHEHKHIESHKTMSLCKQSYRTAFGILRQHTLAALKA